MTYHFKVGDRVVVRSDPEDHWYRGMWIHGSTKHLVGKTGTITEVCDQYIESCDSPQKLELDIFKGWYIPSNAVGIPYDLTF